MTGHIRSIRPARAAIAAVLAFSATPLLAQTVELPVAAPVTAVAPAAAPVVEAPATVSAASTPASPAPTFAPNQPVVQQVASVDERRNAAIAASEAEQATAPVTETRAVVRSVQSRQAERPAMTAAPKADVRSEQAPVTPVRSEAASDVTPVAAPATSTSTETTSPTQASAASATNVARSDQALIWALGGGALLLLGVAGTAIVRRRRRDEDVAFFENEHRMAYGDPAIEPVATPVVAPVAQPMFVEEPVRREMAPTATTSHVRENATLDEMVAAAPDAENPFRTHAKRLRRARFLMAQREAGSSVANTPQTTHAEPVAAPVLDRSQTVYRFDGRGQRTGFMKPRTS